MLDPWIIEEIRRREEEERQHREQRPAMEMPYDEIPSYSPERDGMGEGGKKPGEERGVTIVDFTV